MKKENIVIETILKDASKSFQKSIEMFYPAFDKNGITERNQTYYIAEAFRNKYHGHAFMEVPFINTEKQKNKTDSHFDAFVFNKEIGIFIEAKRLLNLSKLQEFKNDDQRISKTNILTIKNNKHNEALVKNWPKRVYKLLVAEVWAPEVVENSNNIVNWWLNGKNGPTEKWNNLSSKNDFKNLFLLERKHINIISYPSDKHGTLYWVYGYSEISLT